MIFSSYVHSHKLGFLFSYHLKNGNNCLKQICKLQEYYFHQNDLKEQFTRLDLPENSTVE